jgi:hypothetical protein
MAHKHSVRDDGDPRKYYAAIPNIVLRIGLSPYELSLYVYLKQVAGEGGVCWKSTATIAKDLHIGAGTISRTKIALAQPRAELNNKPLIVITTEMQNGGNPNHAITITDIWPENMAELERVRVGKASRSSLEGVAFHTEGTRSTQEGTRSSGEGTRSTGDDKEEPLNKNPEEIKEQQRGTRLPVDFNLTSEMRSWSAEHVPHVDLVASLDEFRDYWAGVPGARGKKLDWLATWRNRMRDIEARIGRNGYAANKSGNGFTSAHERRSANFNGLLAVVQELRDESS